MGKIFHGNSIDFTLFLVLSWCIFYYLLFHNINESNLKVLPIISNEKLFENESTFLNFYWRGKLKSFIDWFLWDFFLIKGGTTTGRWKDYREGLMGGCEI
jgi:hypothetical protein